MTMMQVTEDDIRQIFNLVDIDKSGAVTKRVNIIIIIIIVTINLDIKTYKRPFGAVCPSSPLVTLFYLDVRMPLLRSFFSQKGRQPHEKTTLFGPHMH